MRAGRGIFGILAQIRQVFVTWAGVPISGKGRSIKSLLYDEPMPWAEREMRRGDPLHRKIAARDSKQKHHRVWMRANKGEKTGHRFFLAEKACVNKCFLGYINTEFVYFFICFCFLALKRD